MGELERVIIRKKKKEGGGPPALCVMAPDTNTWVWEKGPSPREEGIVYSDYMGSGPGNKPSHGGNGYKIGSMVATVPSRLGLEARPRESRLRAGGAGAKRLRKSKRIGRRGATGIREQKARGCAAIRRYRRKGGRRDERRKREDRAAMERNRTRERGRCDEKGKDEEEGAATPGAILLEFK